MAEVESSKGWFKIILGVLVTVYGVTAALVSHQANELDSKAGQMTFVGIMELTRGNDAFAVADNTEKNDYDAVTQMLLLEVNGGSQAEIDIWMDTLSDDAYDSMDRFGDLDDQYYEDVYAYPNELYDNAILAYETSQEYSEIGGAYEQITLMLAMGLAFVGWASILDGVKLLRFIFALGAIVVLAFSLYQWWITASIPLPQSVVALL